MTFLPLICLEPLPVLLLPLLLCHRDSTNFSPLICLTPLPILLLPLLICRHQGSTDSIYGYKIQLQESGPIPHIWLKDRSLKDAIALSKFLGKAELLQTRDSSSAYTLHIPFIYINKLLTSYWGFYELYLEKVTVFKLSKIWSRYPYMCHFLSVKWLYDLVSQH